MKFNQISMNPARLSPSVTYPLGDSLSHNIRPLAGICKWHIMAVRNDLITDPNSKELLFFDVEHRVYDQDSIQREI